MRAQQEALGHDCYILRSDNLAEQLLDVLMNVAQMPAVDQDVPRRLESVQREASVGEMGSRYDTDIFLRKEGLLDHARVESGEASNGDVDRSEEHTSELQSLMRISYAVCGLKKTKIERNIAEE